MNLRAAFFCLLLSFAALGRPKAPSNHVQFISEVNDKSVAKTIELMNWVAASGYKYIILEINSPGGYVDAGFKLAREIETSPIPVVCVVDGEAMSMAFYILQSCDTRIMTARSQLMLHRPKSNPGLIDEDDALATYDQLHHESEAALQHYATHMHMPIDYIRKQILRRDWYLSPSEALGVGAVDRVVPSVEAAEKLLSGK